MINGFEITYLVRGGENEPLALQKMAAAFERAGDEMLDMGRYVFPLLVPVFEEAISRQFAAEGEGPNRGAWAELSAAYAAWKADNYPGTTILVRERHLLEGLTDSSSPYALRRIDAGEMEFGTIGVEYASWHQTGTQRMPDRPPLDFDDGVENEIRRAALAGARQALQQARVDEYADLSDFHD